MRAYEAMYIINPELDEEQSNAIVEKFQGIVTGTGGELVKLDKWGKRKLAYEIDHKREGFYVLMQFNGEPATAQELDRVFRITDGIMKYMIVKEDK
ncbi:30S ribosomal protein S6 [Thermincola ferriacetica]|uniref:Small ribosomal subunit protein bS6 n=2 Tax=Thermincola TaxID=278993 RepID=D5XDR2_THEPJ|nr:MULTISPECIES: 30S ribosomal protein S6 [Thermincola]ADG83808.1 ribosomal protein S6 [Thermincola potens JR]KNZ69727.1 30S ribosomal protein S6 [Thermincola ferriacetica]